MTASPGLPFLLFLLYEWSAVHPVAFSSWNERKGDRGFGLDWPKLVY